MTPSVSFAPGRTLLPLLACFVFWLAAQLPAQQPAGEEGRSRFRAIDIYVDSGSSPLAAYQVDLVATNGQARIVGIEGGAHPAFSQPPSYDPKAMQRDRVIIASFSTRPASELPTGRVRVATIHIQFTGDRLPSMAATLQAAGDAQGRRIPANVTFEERKNP